MASHKIATTREEQIEVERHRHCRHFLGLRLMDRIGGKTPNHCAVNVPLADVRAEGKPLHVLPCLCRENEGAKSCSRFELMTKEEAAAILDMFDQSIDRTLQARAAIIQHAGRWKKGKGSMGTIDCPICLRRGALAYSRSAYNGHIHANCTTDNCVSFME